MLNKRIEMLILSSVLSMGMLVGCKKEEVNNQIEEQQIQEEVQEEQEENDDNDIILSSKVISNEEIIAKTKGYYYCDKASFTDGYRWNYKYRDGKGSTLYENKEEELYKIIDGMTYDEEIDVNYESEEKFTEDFKVYFPHREYGQLLRYIDYLEESNQTDSECYKLAIEVRDIYNGEPIDIKYFNRAKDILKETHPDSQYNEKVNGGLNNNTEQSQVKEEQEESKEEVIEEQENKEEEVEYSVDDIKSLMNEVNSISVTINKAKRSGQYVDVSEEVNQLDIIYQEAEEQNDKFLFKNSDVACAYLAIMERIDILKEMIPCYDEGNYQTLKNRENYYLGEFWESVNNLE